MVVVCCWRSVSGLARLVGAGFFLAVAGLATLPVAFASPGVAEPDPAQAKLGESFFGSFDCAGCHSMKADGPRNRGPVLFGLTRRCVGADSGFRYSRRFARSMAVQNSWDAGLLLRYLRKQHPQRWPQAHFADYLREAYIGDALFAYLDSLPADAANLCVRPSVEEPASSTADAGQGAPSGGA